MTSGSIVPSGETCPCCSKARGFGYTGPVYSEEELDGRRLPHMFTYYLGHELREILVQPLFGKRAHEKRRGPHEETAPLDMR